MTRSILLRPGQPAEAVLHDTNLADLGLDAARDITGRRSGPSGGTGTMRADDDNRYDRYDRHIIGNAGAPVDQGHVTTA